MKILYFCADLGGRPAYFVKEQVEAIKAANPSIEVEWCLCKHTGILGGWKKMQALRHAIHRFHPDIIHAHNGMYGLIANMQRRVPVVTTYHGSDIHSGGLVRMLSQVCVWLSKYNIFVGKALWQMVHAKEEKASVIPCGMDLDVFYPMSKTEARKVMGMEADKKYVLFTSHFTNEVKDPALAMQAIAIVNSEERIVKSGSVELIELKGYNRPQVNMLLNAVDALLMTSKREGSPQIIKEAIAVGTPIVTTNVGDVEQLLAGVENAAISTSRDPKELADLLQRTMSQSHSKKGREVIEQLGMDNADIVQRIVQIYEQVISRK